MTTMTDREKIYDEQLSPLIDQIVKICEANDIALAMGVFTPTPAQPNLYVFTSIPGSFDSNLHSLITMILTGEAKFCALGFDKEGDSDEPKIH